MSDEQPQPPVDERTWVTVPPPHPYAAVAGSPKSPGAALAIAAMALGLVALFTVTVSALYFSIFALLGAIAGVVAIVLGAVALAKRSNLRAAAIVGVIGGVLSVAITILLAGAGALALASNLFGGTPGSGSGSDSGDSDDGGWTQDSPTEALIEWPSNMASGGIVFEGPGDPLPRSAEPLQPGTAPVPAPVDRTSSNDVLIYVDYRCPHCLVFEQTNGAVLSDLVQSGSASVEIIALSFLDRGSEGAYYSSRAAGAMACLADSQPEAAWAAHAALLDPAVQPGAGPGLTNDQLVAVLDTAVGGLNPAVQSCIKTERFVPFAQAMNQWIFTQPVPNGNDEELRISGTPSVFVNGDFFEGATDDASAFAAFLERQLN